MISRILGKIKSWWKRHIIDEVPEHLEDDEFSEKWRKW
jgi:hypothetical protein